ncbi:MAG: hypothetical protein V4512_08570 [Pseudomonadota bacterium]
MFAFVRPRGLSRLGDALAIGALLCLLPVPSVHAQDLTLADALSRVAAADPAVAVIAAQRAAADASIRQADIKPQDVVTVDVEDFARSGGYTPVASSQTTAWYERTWERRDKREARVGAARSERDVTQQRGRLRQLDMLAQAQAAWVEALAADAEIPVAQERLAQA